MTPIIDFSADNIQLPLPPDKEALLEMEIYARFMKHLRLVPNSKAAIKVLSAIQFTADMSDHSDAHVSKVLVDMGLKAPRMAFPAEFLEYADHALMRGDWDIGGPSPTLRDLQSFWNGIGEGRFAAYQRSFPLMSEDAFI